MFAFCLMVLLVHFVAAKVTLDLPSDGIVNSSITVNWTREEADTTWDLRFVTQDGGDLGLVAASATVANSTLKGKVDVTFPEQGIFNLTAVSEPGNNHLGTSGTIRIEAPPQTSTASATSSHDLPTDPATTDNPTSPKMPLSTSKSSSGTPAIIGGVIGGFIFFLLIGLTFCFIRRRRKIQVTRRFTFHRELMVQRRDAPQVSLQPMDYDLEAAVIAAQNPSADPFDRPASRASRGSTQTTRQLDIELRITKLQAQILEFYNQPARARDVEKMRRQVEWLQGQEDSPWALGLTDERPPNYDLYMTH